MAIARSRRLRLLESLRRTISEMLHDRVSRVAEAENKYPPQNTSAIYTSASTSAPELLDQLLLVHRRVREERGEKVAPNPPNLMADRERQAMLSAVRAAVGRSQARFGA